MVGESSNAELDADQVRAFASAVRRFSFRFDRFDEPLMYPSDAADVEATASYFLFMVAIDHRTETPGQQFKALVNGIPLRGAELLWALGKREFDKSPESFSAKRMSQVSTEDVRRIFSVDGPVPVQVAGPDKRAELLRDAAKRLLRDYHGSVLQMIRLCEGQLRAAGGGGLLDRLTMLKAYSDPKSKKSFLLVKFLERRHLLEVKDPQNLHVPVDNVLQRIALRAGIVVITRQTLARAIREECPIDKGTDLEVRGAVERAFDAVSEFLGLSPTYLDDILWEFGRAHCRLPTPTCGELPDEESRRVHRLIISGPRDRCPFSDGCKGYLNPDRWSLREPTFSTTYF